MKKTGKSITVGFAGSAGLGVLVAWGWNGVVPAYPMPVEVAAVVGALPAYIIGLLTN